MRLASAHRFGLVVMIGLMQVLSASAQNQNLDAELDAELDRMYQGQSAQTNAQTTAQVPTPAGQNGQGQPIYIVNQTTPTSTAQVQAQTPTQIQNQQPVQVQNQNVQKQPVTYVQDTPVVESRAQEMRRQRQEAETNTENRIVEKLEQSRLDDEKRRADALFGNQPQVVQPVVIQKQETTHETVREEIRSSVRSHENLDSASQSYFSGLVGVTEYPDVQDVSGNYTLGVAFGTISDDRLAFEGSFIHANYNYELPYWYWPGAFYDNELDINQYALGFGARYFFLDSFIRPSVAGLAQYSYREYNWPQSYSYVNTMASSHALDLGISGGLEVAFASGFSIGLDYRYYFNVYSRLGPDSIYQYGGMNKIEKYSHTVMGLTGRFQF